MISNTDLITELKLMAKYVNSVSAYKHECIYLAIAIIENLPKWETLLKFLEPCPLTFDLVAWVELPSGRIVLATLTRNSSSELTIRYLPDRIEIQPYDVVRIAKVPEAPK